MKRATLSLPKPVQLQLADCRRVSITQVGCGGTGSHLASGLVAMGQALAAQGIALELLLVDPDVVEPKNVGRQLFAAADVGRPKAQVLAERLNAAYGTKVGAGVWALDAAHTVDLAEYSYQPDVRHLVVGCVDNPAARAQIAHAVGGAHGRLWWCDCGNDHTSGQVALGNTTDVRALKGSIALGLTDRLPAPNVVYPDLTQSVKMAPPKRRVSCAELMAAGEQALMVNRVMAAWTATLLADFLVTRTLKYFAVAVDLQYAGTRAYALDVPTLAAVTGLRVDQLVAAPKKRKDGEFAA